MLKSASAWLIVLVRIGGMLLTGAKHVDFLVVLFLLVRAEGEKLLEISDPVF